MTAGPDWYERYTSSAEYRESRLRKARVIAHLCRPWLTGKAVAVDLGAGTGIIRKELEIITDNPIYGIELDGSFIIERQRMVRADVLQIPFADRSLDFALLNHLYEHVADPGRLFAETYRVLKPGGRAYVTAGSRYAVIEPHYRLPFLSWLPPGTASVYVRWTHRGRAYDDIRFLTYGQLTKVMRSAGFVIHDRTERAIDDLIAEIWGHRWGAAWSLGRRLPTALRRGLLRLGSPQWFFLLERPDRPRAPGSEDGKGTG